jgi:hypothetical protein
MSNFSSTSISCRNWSPNYSVLVFSVSTSQHLATTNGHQHHVMCGTLPRMFDKQPFQHRQNWPFPQYSRLPQYSRHVQNNIIYHILFAPQIFSELHKNRFLRTTLCCNPFLHYNYNWDFLLKLYFFSSCLISGHSDMDLSPHGTISQEIQPNYVVRSSYTNSSETEAKS